MLEARRAFLQQQRLAQRAHAPPHPDDVREQKKKEEQRKRDVESLWEKVGHLIGEAVMGSTSKKGSAIFEDMFRQYDVNCDGELSVEELTQGL